MTEWQPTTFRDAEPRKVCTDCGVSRMADPKACGTSCQFLKPDYPGLEAKVHGRARDPGRGDELHFGPYRRMVRAVLKEPAPGAQWTGITTAVAARLLETGVVEGVVCMAPAEEDRWRPVPVLVTDAEGMARCRGMRMGYAPLLAQVERAADAGYRRLAVVGIPCQIYALRALEARFGFERLYVLGTPCSDNTSTEKFHHFLDRITAHIGERPETVTYLEFRTDYRVELRFEDGRVRTVPFLMLPLAELGADFFPLSCRTCVDYTNVLSDLTVGYMAGHGQQWLIIRNTRGEEMVEALGDRLVTAPLFSKGKRHGPVAGFKANLERAAGGLPLRAMPNWLRPIMAWVMPRFGPRGLEFARTRVEMKAVETLVHLGREKPALLDVMVPDHVRRLAAPYGLGAGGEPGRPAEDPPPQP